MKNEFVETGNTKQFERVCNDLTSAASLIGPSLAMITGPAGRGKTEAAKHYAVNSDAIYIPPMNIRTPAMILREIAFELDGVRPSRSDACLGVIGEAMKKSRRLIMIDEADLLQMACLEMLRNVNERFACPIMLIGEDELKGKLGSRRRLSSRVRHRLEFASINQPDITYYFRSALGQKIGADVATAIHHYAKGDWRPVLTVAVSVERAMKASSAKEITVEMVNDCIKNS
ncbi:MAG: ATP-binding protein [Deltaproteobacteria bacterium]|nr:ATP-binding protein [Deltaproteobacteria bacterium]